MQVDGDRFLVARFAKPGQRVALTLCRSTKPAQDIAAQRMFDFQDLGTKFSENGCAVGCRDHRGDINDADTCQRQLGFSLMYQALPQKLCSVAC
jgi:hypothetical protein